MVCVYDSEKKNKKKFTFVCNQGSFAIWNNLKNDTQQ